MTAAPTKALAVVVVVSLLGMACQVSFEDPGAQSCTSDSDCPSTMGCAEEVGRCFEQCTVSTDCPTLAYRCEGELCLPVVGAECAAHAECDSPEPCELAEGSACIEGQCVYEQWTCDAPPQRECSADDQTIRIWEAEGTCTTDDAPPQGECVYSYTDVPCPGCQENCLQNNPCDTVSCPDENGGCHINGLCLPTDPPTCQYEDAPTNTVCDQPGSALGAQDGICDAGVCVEPPVGHNDFFTDFSEYAAGEDTLTDWTIRQDAQQTSFTVIADAAYLGGQALRLGGQAYQSAIRDFITWDALDGQADVEVLTRMVITFGVLIGSIGPMVRAGELGGYTAYVTDQDQAIVRVLSGSGLPNALAGPTTVVVDNPVLMRLRVEGTSIKYRVWPEDEPEPAQWTLEGTDSNAELATGAVGFSRYSYTWVNQYVDWIAVAVGGGAAVIP